MQNEIEKTERKRKTGAILMMCGFAGWIATAIFIVFSRSFLWDLIFLILSGFLLGIGTHLEITSRIKLGKMILK